MARTIKRGKRPAKAVCQSPANRSPVNKLPVNKAPANKAPANKPPVGQRLGRASEEFQYGVERSSLGSILVASSRKGVVAILIGNNSDQLARELQNRFPQAHLIRGDRAHQNLVGRVVDFIERPTDDFDLPLDIRGSAFQKRVWKAVRKIALGETSTYTEIAHEIGSPKAARAIGNACSTNNLAIVIPCHRVLHKDGSLCRGSHWGIGGQRALIRRETVAHR
jgi:AraC family transcriptional regulator of adaptative response/methylated-DNA-[protein]-cysteine methyltransferase